MELPDSPELAPAWGQVRDHLRRAVGETTYDIWLAGLAARDWDGTVLLLDAPPQTRDWIAKRFDRVLRRCVHAVLGAEARVAFATTGSADRRAEPSTSPAPIPEPPGDRRFNPRLSFDQFIIGDGNRLAHAAALAVAELPGQAYNPLFLYAPPGCGKTHLLHAIGNYVQAYGGGTTVRYTTVEAFTNHFISSLGTRATADTFKRRYRDADVLLIDDVQFLASKAKTEEEFFHTFNALYETGRQLVLTCDRLPRQLLALGERLRERLESGLVAEIDQPDLATRIAILRKRAALDRVRIIDPAVLELIASRVEDNVRSLEGALIRIVAHHSLTGRAIDLALATSVLDDIHPLAEPVGITIPRIQTVVAARYGVTTEELASPSRVARIAWPRQVAMQLARDLTDVSLSEIGAAFGGRNHATILYACKRVSDRLKDSQEAEQELAGLRAVMTGGGDDHRS